MSDFAIDKNALDDEWLRQSVLVYQYNSQLVEAQSCLQAAKSGVDVTRAEVDGVVRASMEKPTEGKVKAAVESSMEVREAVEELHVIQKDVGMLQAALNALEHKKRALENLVKLHLCRYYEKPHINDDEVDDEDVEDFERRATRRGRPHKREQADD